MSNEDIDALNNAPNSPTNEPLEEDYTEEAITSVSDEEMEKELLPCPFCGGECVICDIASMPYVQCVNCLCESDMFDNKESALKAWNTRSDKLFDGKIDVVQNDGDVVKAWENSRPKQLTETCVNCHGSGFVANNQVTAGESPCPVCHGTGYVLPIVIHSPQYTPPPTYQEEVDATRKMYRKNMGKITKQKEYLTANDSAKHEINEFKKVLKRTVSDQGWIELKKWDSSTVTRFDKLWICTGGLVRTGYYHNEDNLFYSPRGSLFTGITHVMPYYTPSPPKQKGE